MIVSYDINYNLTEAEEKKIQKIIDKNISERDLPPMNFKDSIADYFNLYGIPAEVTNLDEDLCGKRAEEWLEKNILNFNQCLIMVND